MQFTVRMNHGSSRDGPCTVKLPPEDEQLAYSKHVEDVIRIKFIKVHLVGSIIQFIMMQVNIILKNY